MNSLIYTLGNIVLGVTLVGASIAYTCGVIYVVLQALKAVVKR